MYNPIDLKNSFVLTFDCVSQFYCLFPFSSCKNLTMKTEVSTAANFVTRLLRGTGLLSEEQLQQFRFSLEEALGGKTGSFLCLK